MAPRPAIINVMTGAAMKAARGLVRDYGELDNLQVSRKGPGDFVTAADKKSEQILHEELSKGRPDFGFLMEESGAIEGDPRMRWIIDPLDGTLNLMHGIPHFSISIANEAHGEIVAGVVYDPLRDEMFWAERGTGAFLNDRRIRVSGRNRIEDALIATGIPAIGRHGKEKFQEQLGRAMTKAAGIRSVGSAALALAYVAAGRFDGFWDMSQGAWDIAAGLVLVREAGGLVSDMERGADMVQSGNIIAANGDLFDSFSSVIRGSK